MPCVTACHWNRVQKFSPNFAARNQGIMWAPVLRSSDISTIHHMVIWSCTK